MSKQNRACPGATDHSSFLNRKELMVSGALSIAIACQVWARCMAKKDISLSMHRVISKI